MKTRIPAICVPLFAGFFLGTLPASGATVVYRANLSGANEVPPAASSGTGQGTVTIDTSANTMRVQVSFSGLTAGSTASHIHCCTATPGTGTAGVATATPTFPGFPLGVTSGTYDQTFDLLAAATYNPAFVTAQGGVANAEAALLAGLAANETYLNIHSTMFPGGEIRGTLIAAPVMSKAFATLSSGLKNTTALTFRLTNPNNLALSALQFNDTLPIGLVVATPNGLTGACDGGTVTATAGSNVISLAGAGLAGQASCTFSVNVATTGAATGAVSNTTSTVSSAEGPPGAAATATLFVGDPLQISYAANLAAGDSLFDITNVGTLGASLQSGTTAAITGSICANVYAFTPDEQLVSCCSCPVTPNGLVSLSAKNDLASNTLTPAVPTALVIKVLATVPVSGSCANSAAAVTTATLANGLKSFGTTIHQTPTAGSFSVTETPFLPATLSAGELSRVGNLCNFILANGSGFGVCRSCRLGGLGATHQ